MKIDKNENYVLGITILASVLFIITLILYITDPLERAVKFSGYVFLVSIVIGTVRFKSIFLSYLLSAVFFIVSILYYFIA